MQRKVKKLVRNGNIFVENHRVSFSFIVIAAYLLFTALYFSQIVKA